VDNLLSAERSNLPEDERISFIEGSITDPTVLSGIFDEFHYIFHLATFHGNQNSMADPLSDHANNTITTLKLCEHIKDFKNLKKIVYSSAGCTVAEKTYDDVTATAEDAPVSLYLDSPYQISKMVGEFYFNYYWMRFGMPVVKARFQNVYGPGEILGAGKWRGTPATIWRNVTPTFIYKAIKNESLPVEAGGESTRDFIYVDDIVDGLLSCAAQGRSGDVYNLASGLETSILELAQRINELTKNPMPIDLKPKRNWDRSGKRFGSIEKAQRELNFKATTDLQTGLKQTIAWTRDNIDTIDACIARHAASMAA
jgi:nucleoside-diphosphate-sugar epimerase